MPRAFDPGFDPANVDVAMLDLSLAQYNETTGPAFAKELVARAAQRPKVVSAALAADLPLDGGRMGLGGLRTPGTPARQQCRGQRGLERRLARLLQNARSEVGPGT